VSADDMQNLRKHGSEPFRVAVLHSGPGAPGEMGPVARELGRCRGVLEPLQTRDSIQGQIDELREVVEQHGQPPLRIIGWSWGAWLGYLFAARYPSLVDKLILVGSGPFEEAYVPEIARRRFSRLSDNERIELERIEGALAEANGADRDVLLGRFGALLEGADAYDAIPIDEPESMGVDFHIFERVWREAAGLRAGGYSKQGAESSVRSWRFMASMIRILPAA